MFHPDSPKEDVILSNPLRLQSFFFFFFFALNCLESSLLADNFSDFFMDRAQTFKFCWFIIFPNQKNHCTRSFHSLEANSWLFNCRLHPESLCSCLKVGSFLFFIFLCDHDPFHIIFPS
jgi:hypothetical protein